MQHKWGHIFTLKINFKTYQLTSFENLFKFRQQQFSNKLEKFILNFLDVHWESKQITKKQSEEKRMSGNCSFLLLSLVLIRRYFSNCWHAPWFKRKRGRHAIIRNIPWRGVQKFNWKTPVMCPVPGLSPVMHSLTILDNFTIKSMFQTSLSDEDQPPENVIRTPSTVRTKKKESNSLF